LTDGSGAWFDTDSAVLFKEATQWDGRNQISVPTGSQWNHEWLYFTKSGKWVLNDFSNYQGTREGYVQIDESDAVAWLIQNGHTESEKLDKLPESVRQSVQVGITAAEI
jgi:hypothetical protein